MSTNSSNELVGKWIVDRAGKVVGDEVEAQIQRAIKDFVELAHREGGWTTLYRHPFDGSYWERTFPQSEIHGGGPSKLTRLTADQVSERYPALKSS